MFDAVIGWLYTGYGVLALLLMAIVLLLGRRNAANIWLATYLLVEGTVWAGVIYGPSVVARAPFHEREALSDISAFAQAAIAAETISIIAIVFTYLLFVGHALRVPVTAWSRTKTGHSLLVGAMIVLTLASWIFFAFGPGDKETRLTYGFYSILLLPFVGAYGIVAAVQAWRRADNNVERSRLKAYMAAFIIRDGVHIIIYGFFGPLRIAEVSIPSVVDQFSELLLPIGYLAFILALGWGVLRGNVIDLERKLHFTISRGTIAAIFIAMFVGVQTAVGEFVAQEVSIAGAAIATGGLFFVLSPLQRAAERLADKTVPRGALMATADAEAFYREQLQIAYSDGALNIKERRALQNVRERLGLDAHHAQHIEDNVIAAA